MGRSLTDTQMRRVFLDNNLNDELNENGYVVYTHHNESIAQRVKDIFGKYSPAPNFNNFHTTHFSTNTEYKREVLQLAHAVYTESLEKLFSDYEVLFANLMVKYPGEDSIVPTHADWAYIDETKQSAVSVWIPAIDTQNRNDAFGVIPKSHQLYDTHRGPNIVSPYRPYDKEIMEQYGNSLQINPMQAVIYDLRLLHYSKPNLSDNIRMAINIVLIPKGVEVVHHNQTEDKIYMLKGLNKDFFLNYHAHQIPENHQPYAVLDRAKQVTDSEIKELYKVSHVSEEKKKSLWERMKSLFVN